MNDNYFKFSPSVILMPFFFVLLLWIVFWAGARSGFDFAVLGILPRNIEGVPGVFLSAFIHGDLEHLYNNSLPLLVLMAALRFFYREVSLKVVILGILFSGAITWVIGRENYHIGASGLIYVLFSFIFFKGVITKYYRLVALSMAIILVYGGMIWYVFPHVKEEISWEGHLAGLLVGFAFAVLYKTPEYKKLIRYEWERPDFDTQNDAFMKRFDQDGNFVNPPKPEPDEEFKNTHVVTYTFIERREPDQRQNP